MSNWISVNANIYIYGIKKPFIAKTYNLPKDISDEEYEKFCNDYRNFKHSIFTDEFGNTMLVKDFTEEVEDFIYSLPTISGDEGDCEVAIGHYSKHRAMVGYESVQSERRWIDTVNEKLISETNEENSSKENTKMIYCAEDGTRFRIFLYGAVRGRTCEEAEKELIEYLKTLYKYFHIDYDTLNITLDNFSIKAHITAEPTEIYAIAFPGSEGDFILDVNSVEAVKENDNWVSQKKTKTINITKGEESKWNIYIMKKE